MLKSLAATPRYCIYRFIFTILYYCYILLCVCPHTAIGHVKIVGGDPQVLYIPRYTTTIFLCYILLHVCRMLHYDMSTWTTPKPSQEKAVKVFNEDASISVFLLHAGQAAAGLTLTAASHVFLMEPFMKAGEQVLHHQRER